MDAGHVVCHVDPDNPRRAECQCVNMETEDFLTFGGKCDTDTCSTVIWSQELPDGRHAVSPCKCARAATS